MVCGSIWWFRAVYGDLGRYMVVCVGIWWFVAVYGGLWR